MLSEMIERASEREELINGDIFLLGPFSGPITGIWLKFLVYFVVVGFGRGQDDSDFCYYGHTPIPKSFYSHMIGWSCFEHVGYNAVDSEMYACVSDEGFKVPCLRVSILKFKENI